MMFLLKCMKSLYMWRHSDWNELSFVKFVQFQFFNLTLTRYSKGAGQELFCDTLGKCWPVQVKTAGDKRTSLKENSLFKDIGGGGFIA